MVRWYRRNANATNNKVRDNREDFHKEKLDTLHVIAPLLWISTTSGLIPFSLKKEGKRNSLSIASKAMRLYSFLIFFSASSAALYYLKDYPFEVSVSVQSGDKGQKHIMRMIHPIWITVDQALGIANFALVICRAGKLQEVINRVNSLDLDLITVGDDILRELRSSVWFQMAGICLYVIVYYGASVEVYKDVYTKSDTMRFVLSLFWTTLTFVSLCLAFNLLRMIRWKFSTINLGVVGLKKKAIEASTFVCDKMSMRKMVDKAKFLACARQELFAVSCDLNTVYGEIFLIHTSSDILDVVASLFYMIEDSTVYRKDLLYAIYIMGRCTAYTIVLVGIVAACKKVYTQGHSNCPRSRIDLRALSRWPLSADYAAAFNPRSYVAMDGFKREGRKVAPAKTTHRTRGADLSDEIIWATRPFVRFCFAMGLVPFRPGFLKGPSNGKQSSKLHLSYSVLVFSAFTALFCAVIQSRVSNRSFEEEATIQSTVYMAWWLLSGLVSVSSFSMLIARRMDLLDALRDMANIASKMIPKGKNFLRRVRYLLHAEVGVVIFLVAASAGLMYYGIINEQLPPEGYEVAFHLFSFGATLVMSLQFINQLLMLNQLLSLVNAELSGMRDSFKVSSKEKDPIKSVSEAFSNRDDLSLRLRRYAGYHFSICHLGPRLNDVYGTLALLLAMFVLLDVAFQFYLLINSAIVGVSQEVIIFQLGTIILWSCPKVIALILLVAACEFVIDEFSGFILIHVSLHFLTPLEIWKADSTGVLVSEVLLKVKDHQARRELRLFSHQLLHTKVRFTACGFFTLDFSLLTSMTAAVVTHLVILVQFQLAGKDGSSCNCTSINGTASSLYNITESTNFSGD